MHHPTLTIAGLWLAASASLGSAAAVAEESPGLTERASVSSAETESDNTSAQTAFDTDGRFVAVASYASDLVPGDTEICDTIVGPLSCFDVFVGDRQSKRTVRVTVAGDGSEADCPPGIDAFGCSAQPALSESGRYVAFDSIATNLAAGDVNGARDVFVHDRDVDADRVFDEPDAVATTRVSVSSTGAEGNRVSEGGAISDERLLVAFESAADNLVRGDGNGATDVFVHDRDVDADRVFDEPDAVATTRVSVSSTGAEGNRVSEGGAISDERLLVAFESAADNLVRGDGNGATDVFVHDPRAVACRGLRVTILGSPEPDVLLGTAAPDIINGLDGNDVINALEGNDVMCGGAGDDMIHGGAGRDELVGDSGDDAMDSGPNPDRCLGGADVAGDSAVRCKSCAASRRSGFSRDSSATLNRA